jgi:hypothetical protein
LQLAGALFFLSHLLASLKDNTLTNIAFNSTRCFFGREGRCGPDMTGI